MVWGCVTMAKGTIEQRWLFTCGGCGTKTELRAVSGQYARTLVENSGGREDPALGWLCPSCTGIDLHEKRGRKP